MPRVPWKAVSPIDADALYLIVTTEATLRRRRDLGRFGTAAQALWISLEASDGLIGYELHAALIPGRVTTVSAWRDGLALATFAAGVAHRQAVAATRPLVIDSRVHQSTRTGRALLSADAISG